MLVRDPGSWMLRERLIVLTVYRGFSLRKQEDGFRGGFEGANILFVFKQEVKNLGAGAIPQTNPDQFGRRSEQEAALVKIPVFGDERKASVKP